MGSRPSPGGRAPLAAIALSFLLACGSSSSGGAASGSSGSTGGDTTQGGSGSSGSTGGGGSAIGGGGAAPVAVPIVQVSSASVKPGEAVTFSAAGAPSSALTYAWQFGDGVSAVGAVASHAYATEGTFAAWATATDATGASARSAPALVTVAALPPAVPAVTAAPASPYPGVAVQLLASSSDPQASALRYLWQLGDGASAFGSSVTHAYAAEGTYPVSVTAVNAFGRAAGAILRIEVAWPPPTAPAITVAPAGPLAGATATLSATAVDPAGRPLSFAWSFGDGVKGTGPSAAHAWAAEGTYPVTVTATTASGKSSSATVAVDVLGAPSVLEVYCSGAGCGAASPSRYGGAGVGVWRYRNTGAAAATIRLDLAGLHGGQEVALVFTNGGQASIAPPSFGVATTPLAAPPPAASASTAARAALQVPGAAVRAPEESWHELMLERNRLLAEELARDLASRRSATPRNALAIPSAPPAPQPAPPVGTSRSWNELFSGPAIAYAATVQATCTLPGGRNAVFWVDPDSTNAGDVTASDLASYQGVLCGPSGGFARVTNLLGDVWGPAAASAPYLIHDAPGLQDVNVVFLGVPPGTGWGGYFYGINDYLRSSNAGSNEALALFVNAPNSRGNRNYYQSLLLHELTHMVNFYQRTIARVAHHDTWLEETSAMMTEDLVSPAVIAGGYSPIPSQRIYPYAESGGDVSLVGWSALSISHYAMGGALGAFLDRRYGVALYQGLIDCPAGVGSSWICVDGLLRSFGGNGFEDELARFGASTFSGLPATGLPSGFGYPASSTGGLTLAACDLASHSGLRQKPAASLGTSFPATSHTYQLDLVAAGQSRYGRIGIVVPPASTLLVVVH